MIKFALGRKAAKLVKTKRTEQDNLPDAEAYYRRAQQLLEAEDTREKAVADMLQAAEMGHQQAQYELGEWNRQGQNVPQNYATALYWLERAAASGYLKAAYSLALMQANGEGMQQDVLAASQVMQHLAAQKFPPAIVWLMENAAAHGQHQKAFAWASHAAALGEPQAQYHMAYALLHGLGTKTDVRQGISWLKRAAEHDYGDAQWQLARLYETGRFGGMDKAKALHWYERVAAKGVVAAQSKAGHMRLNGIGCAADPKAAVQWIIQAANANDSEALNLLAKQLLTGQGIQQNFDAAVRCLEQAVRLGNADAMYQMGDVYRYGLGVSKDDKLARQWYEQAVLNGHEETKEKLAEPVKPQRRESDPVCHLPDPEEQLAEEHYRQAFVCHFGLNGATQDIGQAFALYKAAAEYGLPRAQTNLGMMFFLGEFVGKDYEKAAAWFKKAALRHDPVAHYNLACLYYHGWGVRANAGEAISHLKAAIAQGHKNEGEWQKLLEQWQEELA